ncbi:MAG: NAD-dependent epimerase/dehydratase family protein [Chloroflexota bacterium]
MTSPRGRALVTGSSGFLGWHLSNRLVQDGYDVVGLDFHEPRNPLPAGMRDLRVDVRDRDAVRRAVSEVKPDALFHAAAQASVSISMREPVVDIETNVLGTVHLAQAAIDAGVPRMVFVSTGGALLGEPEVVPVTEAMAKGAIPESVYGASKLAAERYLALVCGGTDLELSVLRPGNIYGPAQDPHGEAGVVAIFAQRMLRGEPVTIFGTGSQQRDYVYVRDVVEAAVLASTQPASTCLIATGIGTSTQQICDSLAQLTGYERPPVYADERPGDIQRIYLDNSHAREVWGWQPQVSLDEGLAETVEWFRERIS